MTALPSDTLKPTEHEIYTVSEVAQLLRISRNTAYKAVKLGTIPSVRVGQRIVIPRVALDAMLAGASSRSNAEASGDE